MLNIPFRRGREVVVDETAADFLQGFSIEVMPRTAAKIEDFGALLPAGTRVYVAHIEGTTVDDMVATAARLTREGFAAMPHVPARLYGSEAELREALTRYREAGVEQALAIAGGAARPAGPFESSIAMIETGLFEQSGFRRLHVAGHPEGSRDVDPDGSTRAADAALLWKQDWARRTGLDMAIVTQFAFDAAVVIDWTRRLAAMGIELPVHVGVAGPAKLQTLLKFAVSCGVGPSLAVLQKRARDISRLLLPHEPDEVIAALAEHKAAEPASLIEAAHFFPLGGIAASAKWVAERS